MKLTATVVLAATGLLPAAEPFIDKQDLFTVGEDPAYSVYHIPGLVVTAKGAVLAWCEARKRPAGVSDWDDIRILLRRSTDDGITWSAPKSIADVPGPKTKNPAALKMKNVDPNDVTYNNPVLIADRDGTVHMLFCLEYERAFYQRSEDDGISWSQPVEITSVFAAFKKNYDWKVFATGPNHSIQLKSGRLVVPVWLSTGTGEGAHRPSVPATIYSDDSGKTWHAGEIAVPCTDEWINPSETVAIELNDGRVMLNVRSESKAHRRLVTTSADGATGWSTPKFDDALLEPICMGAIVRYQHKGQSLILFSNPHNLDKAGGKPEPGKNRDRKNLSVKLSRDEAETWPINKSIEPGPGMYSDLAVTQAGTILCFYGRGGDGKGMASYSGGALTLARFNLEWLEQPSPAAKVAVSPLTPEAPGKLIAPPSGEPVMLAKEVKAPADQYDVVVNGATAGGVACAVRAAREGCSVLLVQHNRHIGGMFANGMMQWDALYGGPRAPLFTELLRNIEIDAVARFGKDSKAHQILRYTHEHYPIGWVESHVMERECHRLVAVEENIALLLERHPVSVEREGALLKSVTFNTGEKVSAKVFVDATYEGDLFALAKVPYRVGREARDEYNEPHAGKIFVNIEHKSPPQSVAREGLNILSYDSRQGSVDPTSPFTADHASQAYNYRFCLTRDPANRVMLTEPPPDYNREEYVNYDRKFLAGNLGPNLKTHMNSSILPGENHDYPEASWPERAKIIDRHKNFGLGLIWFLQNDESIPPHKREEFRQWGLPRDEFADHGHIPYEMYVREARRIVGRFVLTEHDGMLAKNFARAPVHADSIAVADWYMDSHSCTTESRPGFKYEGKLILTEESRPMQVPYRALLPQGVDNLLVPVCLSSTHVAWGALRLEPVWMQTGEAAGWAAALSKKQQTTPGKLDPELLVRMLAEKRLLVSFFNDLKVDADDPRIPAAQYFGTKGFFADYNAKLDEPLTESLREVWQNGFKQLRHGTLDPMQLAAAVHAASAQESPATEESRGLFLLRLWQQR